MSSFYPSRDQPAPDPSTTPITPTFYPERAGGHAVFDPTGYGGDYRQDYGGTDTGGVGYGRRYGRVYGAVAAIVPQPLLGGVGGGRAHPRGTVPLLKFVTGRVRTQAPRARSGVEGQHTKIADRVARVSSTAASTTRARGMVAAPIPIPGLSAATQPVFTATARSITLASSVGRGRVGMSLRQRQQQEDEVILSLVLSGALQ